MQTLQIYDSQGRPLGEERGAVNQRIKDFFFGGVRAALTKTGSTFEFICFFRARDSSASRSEQYYGVLETRDASELGNFRTIIEDHIERKYEKILDTASEDATVFDALGNIELQRPPGEKTTREDVVDLVSSGKKARLGVGSYEQATVLFQELIRGLESPSLAIAENAQSSQLSEYDVVIEKGPYSGLELLGNTGSQIEEMKERRRKRRQQELGVGPYGDQSPSQVERWLPIAGAALGIIVAITLVIVGACFLGVSIPVIGELPGMTCGDAVGDGPANATYEVTAVSAEWQGTNLTVSATLAEDGKAWDDGPETVIVALTNESGRQLVESELRVNLTNGTFEKVLPFDEATKGNTSKVLVEWRTNATGNTTVLSPDKETTASGNLTDGVTEASVEWVDNDLTVEGVLADNGTAVDGTANISIELRDETNATIERRTLDFQVSEGNFSTRLTYSTATKRNASYAVVGLEESDSGSVVELEPTTNDELTPTPTQTATTTPTPTSTTTPTPTSTTTPTPTSTTTPTPTPTTTQTVAQTPTPASLSTETATATETGQSP